MAVPFVSLIPSQKLFF